MRILKHPVVVVILDHVKVYRANTVVTYLQDTYSNIFGKVKLKGVGGGENPSKNSWKLDKKNHDPDTTQKDRKFTITLPGFTVRRKVG
mgnify:CR=1 FL=1